MLFVGSHRLRRKITILQIKLRLLFNGVCSAAGLATEEAATPFSDTLCADIAPLPAKPQRIANVGLILEASNESAPILLNALAIAIHVVSVRGIDLVRFVSFLLGK